VPGTGSGAWVLVQIPLGPCPSLHWLHYSNQFRFCFVRRLQPAPRPNRPLIREQAFGEALDPDKLERLGRYEVSLDRKLERMLAMLLRLKDLRQGAATG